MADTRDDYDHEIKEDDDASGMDFGDYVELLDDSIRAMAAALSSYGIIPNAERIAHRFDEPYLTRMLEDVRLMETVLVLALTPPNERGPGGPASAS